MRLPSVGPAVCILAGGLAGRAQTQNENEFVKEYLVTESQKMCECMSSKVPAARRGATSIRTENGQLARYVAGAQKAVAEGVRLPADYSVEWSGQFEYLKRAEARLQIVVPVTPLIILLPLYLNFRKLTNTFIVTLSRPFALVGDIWLMWWLGFNMAVAVGFIALASVAAETGVLMLIYLEQAMAEVRHERHARHQPFTRTDLHEAIMLGAVDRVRPKAMIVVAIMAGLVPILWSTNAESEVMQRIAVPMIGGMVSSTILTLIVIPAIYEFIKGRRLPTAVPAATTSRSDAIFKAAAY